MSPLWVEYLRAAGHDVAHWTTLGPADALDIEIVGFAREHGYVVFTRDLDFGALLATSSALRPSVVQFRGPDQFPAKAGPRILHLLGQAEQELVAGAFVSIDLGRTRIRLLPLNSQ